MTYEMKGVELGSRVRASEVQSLLKWCMRRAEGGRLTS